jgi:NAD(P)-dependent dehydrogenase (short-subunit alcohol dehydrogenase family)
VSLFTAADVPDQSQRTVVVTGANAGIGFEAAKVLAAKGARVLLACRDEGRAQAAMTRIAGEVAGADLRFVPLDQGDLASIRKAAALASDEPRVDVLLNNAGIMTPPLGRAMGGIEQQFAVNHLGTFALTALLLPKLAESAGRVVVTASIAHKRGTIDFDNLGAAKGYSPMRFYAQSKLANLLYVTELHRRLTAAHSPVTAIGCHPGVALTELMRHTPGASLLRPLAGRLLNTPAQAAWPALQAATDPHAVPGGYYGSTGWREMRGPSAEARRSPRSQDPELARRLWEVSVALTGIDPGLPSA